LGKAAGETTIAGAGAGRARNKNCHKGNDDDEKNAKGTSLKQKKPFFVFVFQKEKQKNIPREKNGRRAGRRGYKVLVVVLWEKKRRREGKKSKCAGWLSRKPYLEEKLKASYGLTGRHLPKMSTAHNTFCHLSQTLPA
jgi:hypothetical protein